MLSPDESAELEAERAHYPDERALGIEALRIVQRHRGWVSDEALADVSEALGLPLAELDGVATFYNLVFRKPVGRHVILVCNSVSCWMLGADRVCARLSERLGVEPGGTTPDDRFTLLPIVCLGACDHAPVLMVDDDLHQDLDGDGLDPLLERYP